MRGLLLVLVVGALAASAWLLTATRTTDGLGSPDGRGGTAEEEAERTVAGAGLHLEPGARAQPRPVSPPATPAAGATRGGAGGAAPSPEAPARMPGGVAHLTLLVRAADGTPVPRADVNVLDAQGSRIARVVDGRLEVALRDLDARLELHVLKARGRGDQPLDLGWAVLELAAARAGASLEVELPRGLELAGQVVDDLGAPVRNATVLVRPALPAAWSRGGSNVDPALQTRTDAEGRFGLSGLGAGEVLVEALPLPTLQRAPPVSATAGSEGVRITLVRAAEARVRVLDARGEPVAQALVWASLEADVRGLQPLHGVGYGSENRTDADGTWRVPHLDPEGVYRLRVEPPATRPELQRSEVGGWRPEPLVTVRLEAGRVVRGRVIDMRGEPYPDARAYWRQGTRWNTLNLARDGTFAAGGLEAGAVTLRASSSPDSLHQDVQGLETFAEATVAVGRDDVELRVARTRKLGVTLVGWPSDGGFRTGQLHAHGLAGGRTWHVSNPVRTGGALLFDGLEPEGTYVFWFGPAGGDFYALREGLKADVGHVDVMLERGVAIHGRVETPPGAKQAVVQAFLKDRPFHVEATPEADGRFAVRGLPSGTRWRVIAAFTTAEGVRRSVTTDDVAADSDMGTVTPR